MPYHVNLCSAVGLPIPTTNVTLQQLLLNYIPIVFATFLEPLWVFINRTLCILQPFNDLLVRDLQPSESTQLKYSSLPPQLIIWRAWKARHYLLVCVSTVAILMNVLAVTLGSVFVIQSTLTAQTLQSNFSFLPRFSGNYSTLGQNQDQYLYIARTNLTKATPLPPWTAPEFYFLPVNLETTFPAEAYEVLTTGFGVKSDCQQLSDPDPTTNVTSTLITNGTLLDFRASYAPTDGGDAITCVAENSQQNYPGPDSIETSTIQLGSPSGDGPQAQTISLGMTSFNDSSKRSVSFCSQ